MTSLPLLERPSDGAVICGISRPWRHLRRQSESPESGSGIYLAHHRIRRLLRLDSDPPSPFFGLPRCRRRLDLGITPSTKRILVDCAGIVCSPFLDALVVLRSVECCASCQVHWSPTTKENPKIGPIFCDARPNIDRIHPSPTKRTAQCLRNERHSPYCGQKQLCRRTVHPGDRTLKLTTVRSGGPNLLLCPSPPGLFDVSSCGNQGGGKYPHTFPARLAMLPALINLVARLVAMSL